MDEFKMGDEVRIKANKRNGQVRGVWTSLTGKVLFDVRYADDTGRIQNDWFTADDLASPDAAQT